MIDQETGSQFGDKADTQYTPMPLATPIPKDEPQGELEIGAAAAEVAERRERELEQAGRPLDAVRQYTNMNGAEVGKPRPERETVSAEQAAYDQANARRADAAAIKEAEDASIAEALRKLEAGDTQQAPLEQQQQQQQPQQYQEQAQQEVPQAVQ